VGLKMVIFGLPFCFTFFCPVLIATLYKKQIKTMTKMKLIKILKFDGGEEYNG